MVTKATLDYLRDLKKHNQRDWFHANRKRYEAARAEAVLLCDAVIAGLARFEPHILEQDPEDCFFRINRDTRFSKDKTPYKTHFGAFITDRGRMVDRAGYYVHLEPGNCFIAGGLYMPPPPELKAIRRAILEDAAPLRAILRKKAFVKSWGSELPGDRVKTAPRDVPKDHPDLDLLRYKSFEVMRKVSDRDVLARDFARNATDHFETLQPFVAWLNAAVERARRRNPVALS